MHGSLHIVLIYLYLSATDGHRYLKSNDYFAISLKNPLKNYDYFATCYRPTQKNNDYFVTHYPPQKYRLFR